MKMRKFRKRGWTLAALLLTMPMLTGCVPGLGVGIGLYMTGLIGFLPVRSLFGTLSLQIFNNF